MNLTKYPVFADASRIDENGQIGLLDKLLIGDLKHAVFHTLLCLSHTSLRAVKSVLAPELLAAAEVIQKAKIHATA